MRSLLSLLIFIALLYSCMNNSGNDNSPEKIKQRVIQVAEKHVMEQIKDAKKTITKDSLIVFSEGNMKCLIDPKYILTGEIDDDTNVDAIVSIYYFRDQALSLREHLILLNKDGKLLITKVMEGEMKFLSIKDREIYIETSKIASDSPMFGCKICKEINKYRFIGGDTVRIK
jgi:hypothetical protein